MRLFKKRRMPQAKTSTNPKSISCNAQGLVHFAQILLTEPSSVHADDGACFGTATK